MTTIDEYDHDYRGDPSDLPPDQFTSMTIDDALGKNDTAMRTWLRSDSAIDAFYEELRRLAGDLHRQIAVNGRDDYAWFTRARHLYSHLTRRIPEVKPLAMDFRRRTMSNPSQWRRRVEVHRAAVSATDDEPRACDVELWAGLDRPPQGPDR